MFCAVLHPEGRENIPVAAAQVDLFTVPRLLQRKKAYCAKHPKEGSCNGESITVANTYMRTVTQTAARHPCPRRE